MGPISLAVHSGDILEEMMALCCLRLRFLLQIWLRMWIQEVAWALETGAMEKGNNFSGVTDLYVEQQFPREARSCG